MISRIKNNLLINSIMESHRLLTPAFRRRTIFIVFTSFIIGITDFFGLAAILPIIYMASNTSIILTNDYLHYIYQLFGFSSTQYFLLVAVYIVFAIFIVKNLLALYLTFLQTTFTYDLANNLSERQFSLFYKTDFESNKEINSTVTSNNIDLFPMDYSVGIMMPLLSMFSELIVLFLIVLSIAIIDIKLLILLGMVMIPSTIIFYRIIRKKTTVLGDQKVKVRSLKYKYLFQNIHGYTDAILSNKVKYFLQKFFIEQKKLFLVYAKIQIYELAPARFFETAALGGIVIIFSYSILSGLNNTYLIGFLTIFATASYRMLPSLNRIFIALVKIKSYQYVFKLLKNLPFDDYYLKSILTKTDEVITPHNFKKNIEFKNLNFKYKGMKSNALANISFEVKKGEVVGFIGTSGSGKTTLFNILLQLLNESEGQLLIDGQVLDKKMLAGWRHQIGYVRQDYYLLDTSLSENIAFGIDKENIDAGKIWRCIEQASLSDFVKSLPNGINSMVGEKGGKLSGGQKQRIAIARALYHDSEIILFDEATSALDNETENEIIETINNLFVQKKTMLMIAHRYTTLRKCDRIYELKDGKIIAIHTYDDLIRKRIQVN